MSDDPTTERRKLLIFQFGLMIAASVAILLLEAFGSRPYAVGGPNGAPLAWFGWIFLFVGGVGLAVVLLKNRGTGR